MINHPSYRPSTTIRCAPSGTGWRVTRKIGEEKFRLYGHFETLGDAAAVIRNAHRACTSHWRIQGIEVPGSATALDLASALNVDLT